MARGKAMHRQPDISNLPIIANSMALLMSGQGGDPADALMGNEFPPNVIGQFRRTMSEAKRDDGGLLVLREWCDGLHGVAADARARRSIKKWLSDAKRSPQFRRTVKMASQVCDLQGTHGEFIVDLLDG